jgi:radical SAM superfamily enzyme YgiQ (UPF0313 family)
MAIQFGRGCPYSCEFCGIIVMCGRRPRTKSVAQVLAEVDAIHALGVSSIFVADAVPVPGDRLPASSCAP